MSTVLSRIDALKLELLLNYYYYKSQTLFVCKQNGSGRSQFHFSHTAVQRPIFGRLGLLVIRGDRPDTRTCTVPNSRAAAGAKRDGTGRAQRFPQRSILNFAILNFAIYH